jgi:hypothetical protein
MFAVAVKLIPVIVAVVTAVEKLVAAKGKEKQEAAVSLLVTFEPLLAGVLPQGALADPRVAEATRKAIDAVVALQNAVDVFKGVRKP